MFCFVCLGLKTIINSYIENKFGTLAKVQPILEERKNTEMKLVCSVSIGNRQLSTLAINNNQKYSKSTLALCKHPKKSTYCLILFNSQSKNGIKYDVKGNISKIRTNFLHEGKTTIQFKEPPHDFYIQAEIISLQSFLHTLKNVLVCSPVEKEVTCSSLAVTPIPLKNIPPKKLIIRKRSDYPTKGLPRTLESLYINDISRSSLDIGILRLTKLKILDLSNNHIEFLPIEFSNLPNLCELNLSHNLFGNSSPKQWMWISGILSNKLKLLNLSHNTLIFLPDNIIKLYNLITLNVDHNQLKLLPSGIGNLTNLRTFTASSNLLLSLPGSVKKWKLNNIDLSHNHFHLNRLNITTPVFPKSLPICTLKEYVAKTVLYYHICYNINTLPSTLVHYLELAKFCTCGKACFDVFIAKLDAIYLFNIAKNYTHSSDTSLRIPVDCYFCSLQCFSDTQVRFPFT